MLRIVIASEHKYLAKALKGASELKDFDIVTSDKFAENDIVVKDISTAFVIGKHEFRKPAKLADIINAIKLFQYDCDYDLHDITFSPKARKLTKANKEENLTETETQILLKLCISNKKVLSNQLLTDVLGYDKRAETNTLETHIYRLRQKIKALTDTEIIVTSESGYKI